MNSAATAIRQAGLRRRALVAGSLAAIAGCARPGPRAACTAPIGREIWLIERSWHTEIGLSVHVIGAELAPLVAGFSGARVLVFGFGKRSWIEASEGDLASLITGPLPGEGVMQVTALRVTPEAAYPAPARILRLPVTQSGLANLEAALAASFSATGRGWVHRNGSVLYPSSRGYSLLYNCNTWTAEMLGRAGLAIPARIVTARAVMRQAEGLSACR